MIIINYYYYSYYYYYYYNNVQVDHIVNPRSQLEISYQSPTFSLFLICFILYLSLLFYLSIFKLSHCMSRQAQGCLGVISPLVTMDDQASPSEILKITSPLTLYRNKLHVNVGASTTVLYQYLHACVRNFLTSRPYPLSTNGHFVDSLSDNYIMGNSM